MDSDAVLRELDELTTRINGVLVLARDCSGPPMELTMVRIRLREARMWCEEADRQRFRQRFVATPG